LKKYKPDYWLANDAVSYRPYLARSILKQACDRLGGREGASVEIDGIRFTNIRERKEALPWGFAGCRQTYRLRYAS